jgi:hypothetical protein
MPERGGVALPLPNETAEYYARRLQDVIEQHGNKPIIWNEWESGKDGDSARRLRRLEMTADIGSIKGAYTDSSPRMQWVEMDEVEKALREERLVGSGTLIALNQRLTQVWVMLPNRFHDGAKLRVLMGDCDGYRLLTVCGDGSTKVETWRGCVPECEKLRYDQYVLSALCEAYEDGGRQIPAWMKLLFEHIERSLSDVSADAVNRFVKSVMN